MTPVIVAIDGPAASGKSTLARLLAARHGWAYINTGQMYRAVAYFGLLSNLSLPRDEFAAVGIAKSLCFSIKNNILLINGEDLSEKVSLPVVEKTVSDYASISEVRSIMVKKQQEIAKTESVVMDGRDIGTVVFPNATLKIFLVASAEVRATRRFTELQKRYPDNSPAYEEILQDIKQRDAQDREREISPLKKASDAVLVDSSTLSIEDMVEKIETLLKGATR